MQMDLRRICGCSMRLADGRPAVAVSCCRAEPEGAQVMDETIARIETAWRELQEALAGLTDDEMRRPGASGPWSVKDVLAHIAFWHEHMVDVATRRAAGEDVGAPDVDALNARAAEERKDWSPQHARDELQRTYLIALETIRTIPNIDPGLVEGDTWDHYQDHAADIRAWRAKQG
jgi:hypothetical protein